MFGILDEIEDLVVGVAASATTAAVSVATLGTVDLDERSVAKLIEAGCTVAEIATGLGMTELAVRSLMGE